mmetsp:Transcript_4090/g.4737  ORF Transcript_4090/g.4737 Transcript_4090/m.4737 type:complete len:173 (-) Transcript_4090:83-601(-)
MEEPQTLPANEDAAAKILAGEGLSAANSSASSEKIEMPANLVEENKVAVFCCKRCREPLFDKRNTSKHAEGQQQISRRRKQKDKISNNGTKLMESSCMSYFLLEAVNWMPVSEVEGKIVCPKCSTKCGNYTWSGAQCSCGSWICPAIQIPKSKVDTRYYSLSKIPDKIQPAN